jgi:hypothetical protein
MRPLVKDLVRTVGSALDVFEPVYEFGALQTEGQEGFADLRPCLPGKQFVGVDYRSGPGVDVVLDLHALDLADESCGTALCIDTFEHVEKPWLAVGELHRVLADPGLLICTSVMDFPIHAHPADYWRFTPEAFRSLLAPFDFAVVAGVGRENFPHTVAGVALRDSAHTQPRERLQDVVAEWARKWQAADEDVSMARRLTRDWTPPAVLRGIRRLRASAARRRP